MITTAIVGACIAATLVAFAMMRSAAYLHQHDLMTPGSAMARAVRDLYEMVRIEGVTGVARLLGNYLATFAIVIGVTLGIGFRASWKRAIPFLVIAVLVLLALAFTFPDRGSPASLPRARAFDYVSHQHSLKRVNLPQSCDSRHNYMLHYPLCALPTSVAVGALFAMLPVWRRSRMYWINRHQCPQCQYALPEEVERGCSECGWNRIGASPGSEVIRAKEHAATRKRTSIACTCWTVVGLIVYGMLIDRIVGVVPLVVHATPHVRLMFPRSQAYVEARMDATIEARQRWFTKVADDAMHVHEMKWTVHIYRSLLPGGDSMDLNTASMNEMLAVNNPGNVTLHATVSVDARKGTSTFSCGDEQLVREGVPDAAMLSNWLAFVFPAADIDLLTLEAESILRVAGQWSEANPSELVISGTRLPSDLHHAFGRAGVGLVPPRERWATGPLLLVIGCVLLPWAYGFGVIVRLHRKALRCACDAISAPQVLDAPH